jgi:hypothetical protein
MVSPRRGTLRNSLTSWAIVAVLSGTAGLPLRAQQRAASTTTSPDLDSSDPQQPATSATATISPRKIPLEWQPYRIKMLISFAHDSSLTPRLRGDVMRRIRSHAASFVGDLWRLDLQDATGTLDLASRDSISRASSSLVEPYATDQDKIFLLGVSLAGDQVVLAGREYDVFFDRWGPVFRGTAREPTQVARELVIISARMFSPLARLESGDAKRVVVSIKGGRLPTLSREAIDPQSNYRPSFQFAPNSTLLRPMQPVYNEDRSEIIGMAPKPWTFYVIEGRDRELAMCKVESALRNSLPPSSEDPEDPQLIVARTAGGVTSLRLVDTENRVPLPAIDVELVENVGGASLPLGTTDSDGRIDIPQNRTGNPLIWGFVRHGRDTLARLPIMPGAGEEPDLPLNPDSIRLDIEGRVMAMQTQIIDQVARRTILAGNRNAVTNTLEGGMIRKAIEKKDWKQADSLLKQLRESPTAEVMTAKLDAAKEYAREQRPEEKWTGKIKRLFAETEDIIKSYFDPDIFDETVGELEDDLKFKMEDAAAEAAAEGKVESTPAGSAI